MLMDADHGSEGSDPQDLIRSARAAATKLAAALADAQVPADALPGYHLVREIHRGGQGVVFLAANTRTGRNVAIKVVRDSPWFGPADGARFDREVRVLAHLRHPNIVTIHDSGSSDSCRYFVMDYVEGEPLDVYLAGRSLSIRQKLGLFVKICAAVHAAHVRGVIHRDLKPGNIRIDEMDEPRILDFGLAKIATGEIQEASELRHMTVTGQFVGSLPWASPEQAGGPADRIDVRTDIYSLGVVLYHMLSGRFPYPTGGNIHDVRAHIVGSAPARLRSMHKQIEEDVETIVLKCLEKDPERRYQSAAALIDDIDRYLKHQPIMARSPSAAYQLKKLVVRNKLASGLLGVLLALMMTFAAAMSVLYASAARERNRAQRAERDAAREAGASQAVNDFLVSEMLGAAGPAVARGRDLRVAEVLENASTRIGPALADQPLVEAAVRTTIGATYCRLGMFTDATKHLRLAEGIRLDHLGPDAVETIQTQLELVAALRDGRALPEADALSLSLLDRTRGRLGPDDPLTLAAAHERGIVLSHLGRVAESAEMHWDTLVRRRQVLGETHEGTLASLNAWGRTGLHVPGRTGEAEDAFRRAYEHSRTHLGEDHPSTLGVKTNLGSALFHQRRFTEAEQLLLDACADARRVLGAAHPVTLAALGWLSELRKEQDRLDDAERILRDCVRISNEHLGAMHPATIDYSESLGRILLRDGRWAEATRLLGMVLDLRTQLTGVDSRGTAHLLDELAAAHANLGRYERAAELHRRALRIHSSAEPEVHVDTIWSMRRLVAALRPQGKAHEARPIMERLLELRRGVAERPDASAYQVNCYGRELLDAYPADLGDPALALEVVLRAHDMSDEGYHYNRFTLARAYEANGDVAAAVEMAKLALAQAPIEHSAERVQYEALLVRLLEGVGELDASEQVYRDTLAGRREHFADGHSDIATSLFDLGDLLNRHEKYVEAELYLREALEMREALLADPESEPYRLTLACATARTLVALGRSLIGQGRYGEAEPLLLDAYERLADNEDCHVDLLPTAVRDIAALYESRDRPERAAYFRGTLPRGPDE